MSLGVEQYAEYAADPDVLWEVVRTPSRLPEWTGATVVDPPPAWEVGQQLSVVERDTVVWEVLTAEPRVVEVRGRTGCGEVGLGVRVIGPRQGSPTRVVFVGLLDPASTLRARLRDLPALRNRFDEWAVGLRRVAGG